MDDIQLKSETMPYEKISTRIKEALAIITQLGYKSKCISPVEFLEYLTGETPADDTMTLNEILSNDFLMIHEVIEISELKKKGIPVNKHTCLNYPRAVYEAHLTATKFELTHALNKKDSEWLKLRMRHIQQWLNDENMPKDLAHRCRSMATKVAKLAKNL